MQRPFLDCLVIFGEGEMELFKEIKEPRSILFGMKVSKAEVEWLRTRALKEGVSKSSFVRRLLANSASGEGDDATQKRG